MTSWTFCSSVHVLGRTHVKCRTTGKTNREKLDPWTLILSGTPLKRSREYRFYKNFDAKSTYVNSCPLPALKRTI